MLKYNGTQKGRKISPVTEDQNHAQNTNNIDKNGGIGDTGGLVFSKVYQKWDH